VVKAKLRSVEEAKAAAIPKVTRSPQGHKMVRIDDGRFRMGASRREPGRRANETWHDVELTRPFYISTTEVTNAEFRRFRKDHSSGTVGSRSLDVDSHPVVRVTWEEAARYCNWLSGQAGLPPAYQLVGGKMMGVRPMTTGYRMPTEAEWARAARFPGGSNGLKYPWGSKLPVPADAGNFADESAKGLLSGTLSGYNDSYAGTAPVGSFPPNPLGLLDLGGNVAEWVHDIYTIHGPGSGKPDRDPLGPEEGDLHVIRGAGWMDGSPSELRLSYRDYAREGRPDVGFRIARYAR
jgi:formylglycine-generating enzyme required for sulfatase activity